MTPELRTIAHDAFGLDISERDAAILTALARHRFLRADQIRRLHFAELSTQHARARTCQRTLRRLQELRLADVLDRRIGGSQRGSASGVWHLGTLGTRVATSAGFKTGRPHVTGTPEFLKHWLDVAEARVQLVEAERDSVFELLDVKIESEAERAFAGRHGDRRLLRPDLRVVTAIGEYESHRWVEIDRATESLPRVLTKCERYEDYFQTGIEQAATGVFPGVLWVVPNAKRATAISNAIGTHPRLSQKLFSIITTSDFIEEISKN